MKDEICPKCGKEGCMCDPNKSCDCDEQKETVENRTLSPIGNPNE